MRVHLRAKLTLAPKIHPGGILWCAWELKQLYGIILPIYVPVVLRKDAPCLNRRNLTVSSPDSQVKEATARALMVLNSKIGILLNAVECLRTEGEQIQAVLSALSNQVEA